MSTFTTPPRHTTDRHVPNMRRRSPSPNANTPSKMLPLVSKSIPETSQKVEYRNDGVGNVLYYIGYNNPTQIKIQINDKVSIEGREFYVTDIKDTYITVHQDIIHKNYVIDMKQIPNGDGTFRSQGYAVIFKDRGQYSMNPSPLIF